MIFLKDKEITLIQLGQKAITQVFKGTKLVWEAVRSCFGQGFWKNEAPWSNSEGWKNN